MKRKDYGMRKSIMQDPDTTLCYLCGAMGTDCHHIFGGANRSFSDFDGLTVLLCRSCHSNIHDHAIGLHELRVDGQKRWMEYYKSDTNGFRARYGKSYL